jgi:hypothetical protein
MWVVRWKTGLQKAFDGTTMTKAGEWRYHTVDDGWREGAHHIDACKPFSSKQEAEAAKQSVIDDARKGARVCTWTSCPDRYNPIVEIVEVSPRYRREISGYDLNPPPSNAIGGK